MYKYWRKYFGLTAYLFISICLFSFWADITLRENMPNKNRSLNWRFGYFNYDWANSLNTHSFRVEIGKRMPQFLFIRSWRFLVEGHEGKYLPNCQTNLVMPFTVSIVSCRSPCYDRPREIGIILKKDPKISRINKSWQQIMKNGKERHKLFRMTILKKLHQNCWKKKATKTSAIKK